MSDTIPERTRRVKRWRETTPSHPCPSCGHAGWCQVSEDGLTMCRRLAQPGAVTQTDRAGAEYHLWHADRRGPVRRDLTPLPRADEPRRADAATLDAVYRALL